MDQSFTDAELEELTRLVRDRQGSGDPSGDPPDDPLPCPHCGSALERRDVQPRSDVSYVRDRIWLLCSRCGRSGVIDRPGRKGGR